MAKEWKLELKHENILEYMRESECPVVNAKEVGEMLDMTSQQASGALRSLETHGYIKGKTLGMGMHKTKIYYFSKE